MTQKCDFKVGDIVWIKGEIAENSAYAKAHLGGKLGPYTISSLTWCAIADRWLAHFALAGTTHSAYVRRLRHDVFMTAVKKAIANA